MTYLGMFKKKTDITELGFILGRVLANESVDLIKEVTKGLDISQDSEGVLEIFYGLLFETYRACLRKFGDPNLANALIEQTRDNFYGIVLERMGVKHNPVFYAQLLRKTANKINEYLSMFRDSQTDDAVEKYASALVKNIKGDYSPVNALRIAAYFSALGEIIFKVLEKFKLSKERVDLLRNDDFLNKCSKVRI
jgi:hypothetical protein